ncbi:MAG: class I SAM-dependent methyltransferase [Polyangiaceae bacterium]|nr:class I SAM-dependent methyltransferase [Myxococcales bacterium]MCB9584976.1 class I SAM-dependent methyltransferase [Polyangiaceae bacterium]MCB9607451.1 class I SAM-dependent methyltransferase [Polyangiaceae bacterium]
MKAGQASRTAVMVCQGRAWAHAAGNCPRFSDPTAMDLLPADAAEDVRATLEGRLLLSPRSRFTRTHLIRNGLVQAVRTVAIDDAVRRKSTRQLVILGAGLDGRAWRMPELQETTVFEVDHPDTQRAKQAALGERAPCAKEVRFAAVDFTRDDLAERLAASGHDAELPTTWIWEGVVMYLTPEQVEATLSVIRDRSAKGSRLIIVYHRPAWVLKLVNLFVSRLGEPFRSTFSEGAMRALLARYGFQVSEDRSAAEVGGSLSAAVGQATRFATHLRIAVADS